LKPQLAKTATMEEKQQRVIPALRVASYVRSKPFYESLGFREQWTHQFEPGFPVFASIVFDGMEIFLTEHTGDCQFGGLVHFYVDNVDGLHAAWQARNITVAEPPNNSLGPDLRTMSLTDADSNRLMFLTVS
jgi:hypothetical protein